MKERSESVLGLEGVVLELTEEQLAQPGLHTRASSHRRCNWKHSFQLFVVAFQSCFMRLPTDILTELCDIRGGGLLLLDLGLSFGLKYFRMELDIVIREPAPSRS